MKEFYADKPDEIEVFTYGGGTDIILRKDIAQEQDDDGNERWACDERQVRQCYSISTASVKSDFSSWWAVAGGEEPLNAAKVKKIEAMSAACRESIIAGFDVVLTDGKERHFSMTVEDQLNINSLYGLLTSGMTQVPYHADGDVCEYFSAEDFGIIVQAAIAHKTYQESYFNSLKIFIKSLQSVSAVEAVAYGVEIPEQYQSDVLRAMEA